MITVLSARKCAGQSMITLGLLIAFFVVGVVGIFGFEISRIALAREQLAAACDSASLAAAATLASSDNVDPIDAHNDAMNTALTTFQQNSVLGVSLAGATLAGSAEDTPGPNQSSLFLEFLDPHSGNQPVPFGDPKGKIVRISAAFGAEPAFGRYLGIQGLPVRVGSSGGVPDLDVVLCFDVSGSIDDQTPVTFVRRTWHGMQDKVVHEIAHTRPGSPVQPFAQGRIYDILGPVPTGTRVNGIYPQYLGTSNQSDVRWPLTFSEDQASSRGLRRGPNAGSPPGNMPPYGAGTGNIYTYTDLVVNIDGRDVFGGITEDGYAFPDIATVVEAARGNLENDAVYRSSKADTALPYITPRPGYQQKYFELAAKNLRPLADAQRAANDFFTIMNTNTDGHFGLVCFSDIGGTGPGYTYQAYNVDGTFSGGGRGNFPVPQIMVDQALEQTNFEEVVQALPGTVATTGTNIGDAVNKAVIQLQNRGRPGAKKAIVLFTDGMPTVGNPLHSDPWTNARRAAKEAKTAGIPIYTIGLAQNPEIIPQETAILNDTNPNENTGGMAAIAGNGGKFFLVTDVDNLRYTFENIARHLVQLVR